MVAVPAEPFLATRHLTQAFPPTTSTEKAGRGSYGGARNTEVNADHLPRGWGLRFRDLDHDVEPKPTLAVHAVANGAVCHRTFVGALPPAATDDG